MKKKYVYILAVIILTLLHKLSEHSKILSINKVISNNIVNIHISMKKNIKTFIISSVHISREKIFFSIKLSII